MLGGIGNGASQLRLDKAGDKKAGSSRADNKRTGNRTSQLRLSKAAVGRPGNSRVDNDRADDSERSKMNTLKKTHL